MKNTKIIGLVLIIIAVIVVGLFINKTNKQQVSKVDAIDTVGDFYFQWLDAVKAPTAEMNQETLSQSPILSKELRNRLKDELNEQADIDPVLCQAVVPENISLRKSFEDTEEAQVLVMSRDKKVSGQALVTLVRHNEGWYIGDIECSLGEFEEEREFTFEREGYLLKDSLPSPYDSKNWHLVFEENEIPGHVAPLFFNSESQCTNLDGNKSVCNPAQFSETEKVLVRGQMSERGATINQLEFVK